MSTSGDTMSTFTTSGDIMSTSGDTMSTFTTSGDTMNTFSTSRGYHEYIGGCSVHRGFNINQRLL